MTLVGFLIAILILAIVVYVVNLIIGMLSLPPQVKTIALIIIGLLALIYILSLFGVQVGSGFPNLR